MIITSKFDGFCTYCRGAIKAGEQVIWQRGVKGVQHASAVRCEQVKAERAAFVPAPTGVTVDGSGIVGFLTAARDRGLKFPKVRFADANGREIAMTLAGSTSKYPGAVQVKLAGEWIGRVEANGNVAGPLSRNAALVATLTAIASDPATAAKTYGQLTGSCSFCAKQLTDEGSIEVGYGPRCAAKYGLPHKAKGSGKVVSLPEVSASASVQDEFDAMSGADIDETAYDADPSEALMLDDSLPLTYGPNAALLSDVGF